MTETEKQEIFEISKRGILILFRDRQDKLHINYIEEIEKLRINHEGKTEKLKAERTNAVKVLHNNIFGDNE